MDKEFFLAKIKQFTETPSYSREEGNFISLLNDEFHNILSEKTKYREVKEDGKIQYAFYYHDESPSIVFIVHVDRVRVGKVEIVELTDRQLQGQFDNLVSVVTLLELVDRTHLPINILFTTKEEIIQSSSQVVEIATLFPHLKLVSVDIDVCKAHEPIDRITLRSFDRAGLYNMYVVDTLRDRALECQISFTENEVGWGMSDTGFVCDYTDGKVKGAGIGIPLYNYHSNKEIVDWKAIEAASLLIEKLITRRKEDA